MGFGRDLVWNCIGLALFSDCKVTTKILIAETTLGKIHVISQEIALYTRNTLIHSEKFSEGFFSHFRTSVISH